MSKAKLNLDQQVVNIDGTQVIPPTTLAKAFAGVLIKSVSQAESEILKLFNWAGEFDKDGFITIDEGDSKIIKDFVVNHKDLYIMVKAPILKAIAALDFK